MLAAWGQNRESHGTSNAFVFESNISWLDKNYLYSRVEFVGKELPHMHDGFLQPMHEVMNIGAFTLGYTRDIFGERHSGRLGIGADMTMYYVPLMLQESYGAPLSFHVFLRYRFGTVTGGRRTSSLKGSDPLLRFRKTGRPTLVQPRVETLRCARSRRANALRLPAVRRIGSKHDVSWCRVAPDRARS